MLNYKENLFEPNILDVVLPSEVDRPSVEIVLTSGIVDQHAAADGWRALSYAIFNQAARDASNQNKPQRQKEAQGWLIKYGYEYLTDIGFDVVLAQYNEWLRDILKG